MTDALPAGPDRMPALELALKLAQEHHRTGRLAEAKELYQTVLGACPDHAPTLHLLGVLAAQTGHEGAAAALMGRALALRPDLVGAHLNLGTLYRRQDRLRPAAAHFLQALALRPDLAEAEVSLGLVYYQQNRLEEAAACFRRALALKPDDPLAHKNYGWVLLKQGDLAAGFREYEWRWAIEDFPLRRPLFAEPAWQGEDPAGRTLLLYAEQGLGDTIQFVRYAPLIRRLGARVVLECPRALVRLLTGLPGLNQVLATGETRPRFDAHAALMSLPGLLGTTLETVPAEIPYLAPPPGLTEAWAARLPPAAGRLRVGVVWAGHPRPEQPEWAAVDRRRSMAPYHLAPLAGLPGIQWISLQKDKPPLEVETEEALPLTDLMDQVTDLADTAALIMNLDLIIGVDTAVIHLAGALGRPVWLLSRFDGCWRWLHDRDDSPWYPTLRLFRQPVPNDWDSVVTAVLSLLQESCRP